MQPKQEILEEQYANIIQNVPIENAHTFIQKVDCHQQCWLLLTTPVSQYVNLEFYVPEQIVIFFTLSQRLLLKMAENLQRL